MTLLVVGLSHRTAPVTLLDRAAVTAEAVPGLLRDLAASPHVAESMVVTTCNRVEVYADISRFHGALDDVTDVLCKATGVPRDELTPHLFVHYDDRAVAHLFGMASGLDSMVVGESQVLGQVRVALRAAQDAETAGRAVNEAAQAALRVGKRVHSTTGIDRAGQSVVSVALAAAGDLLGGLAGSRVLVLGAGSMSALVLATLSREDVTDVVVANRTLERAEHLAADHGGRAVPLAALPDVLPEADLVVACTGAAGVVLDGALVAGAMAARPGRPLVVVDLAMPHDTDPAIADLPGVSRLDLEDVAARPGSQASAADVGTARAIVAEEAAAFLAAAAAARVEPVVVSLRARADQVVDVELERLRTRLPGLDDVALAEVQRSVRRAVQALLHTPTVRMKELAAEPDGTRYATALHALFDLDPSAVAALVAPEVPAVAGPEAELVTAPIRLATRGSALATAQSRAFGDLLAAASGREVELVIVVTRGDVDSAPLATMGGEGVFVAAVREALLDGRADVAVHSLKDLPTAAHPGLELAAVPARVDPRDVLVARDGLLLHELPEGARIGTGSPRRVAQLRAVRPDLELVGIRGNVDTRLGKVADGEVDAIVLARAGLERLGRLDAVTEVLDPLTMLPAPAQGALAVERAAGPRDDADSLTQALRTLDDPLTRAAVTAERSLLAALEAGCSAPLGAYADVAEGDAGEHELYLRAVVADLDGTRALRMSITGPASAAPQLGRRLADDLLAAGAADLMGEPIP